MGNVVVAGPDSVWFDLYTAIGRIDVETNEATVISTGGALRETGSHAYASGSLWLYHPPNLIRYDAATSEEIERFRIGTADPESRMASGAGSLWIAEASTGLYRLDPKSGEVIAHVEDVRAFKVFSDGESVWIADEGAGTVAQVDTETNSVGEPVTVREMPGGILGRVVGEDLWVALSDQQGIAVVDGESGAVVKKWRFNDPYAGYVDVGFDSVWIPVFHRNEVWRVPLDELDLPTTVGDATAASGVTKVTRGLTEGAPVHASIEAATTTRAINR